MKGEIEHAWQGCAEEGLVLISGWKDQSRT